MHKAEALALRSEDDPPPAASAPRVSRSAKTFQFVTANPTSDAERSQNKILVRSNASIFHWGRYKNSDAVGTRRRKNAAGVRTKWSRKESETWSGVEDGSSATDDGKRSNKVENKKPRKRTPSRPVDILELMRYEYPANLLDSRHHDPFEAYPSDLPKEWISPMLDQVYSFVTRMFVSRSGQTIHPLADKWLRLTASDRALFHAAIFSHLLRSQALAGETTESREQMLCYTEILRGVHQKFKDNSISCEDENILAVYTLSYHGDPRIGTPIEAPNQGPLKELQLLHVYGGRLKTVPIHLQGLAKMLALRGGLSKIKLPGLAQTVSYGDVILACQQLTRPLLPYHPMHADLPSLLAAASRKDHPLTGIGRGFGVLPSLVEASEAAPFMVVLKFIIQYTLAIDDYTHDRPEAQPSYLMSDQRNFVAHSLMLQWPDAKEEDAPFFNLVKLATLVYSLLVVFPIPPIAAPFRALATKIKLLAVSEAARDCWGQAPLVALWVHVMGAVAATGTVERTWYVKTLAQLTSYMKIHDWATLKERMNMFLWFEPTNDPDGIKLWEEIRSRRAESETTPDSGASSA